MRNILLTTTNLTAIGYNNDPGMTVTLPVGRIVWGHPSKPKPATDNKGNPKLGKDGQQMMETSFGLAIPIDAFNAEVWPHMSAEAAKGYPNGVPNGFSWKYTHPDEVHRDSGKPYSEAKEGYAGHIVLAVSTMLEPPAVFQHDGQKWNQMEPGQIKCGDYVQLEANFKINVPDDRTHTPGLYVNPRSLAFAGYGQPINSVAPVDPNKAFGNGPPPLPAGASATPVGNAGNLPGMPGAPGNAAAAGGSQAPTMPNAGTAAPGASGTPMPAPSTTGGTPGAVGTPPTPAPAPAPAAPAEPQRPADPTHVHDNGDGTEQWLVNGAWDGQRHPIPAATPTPGAPLPPPATGFVQNAASGAPAMPSAPPR